MEDSSIIHEAPIGQVRGARDGSPDDFKKQADLEQFLLFSFESAGYRRMRTPVLEFAELHERKSGAGIVSKLFEVLDGSERPLCLRPELTAGIVRAYNALEVAPSLPWRVSASGPVFRRESELDDARLREFHQIGVELLGASGPIYDAEIIWLADWSLRQAGVKNATIRIGHVGLILELLDRAGLPKSSRSALVEMLSALAAEGGGVKGLEDGVDRLSHWLRSHETTPLPASLGDDSSDSKGVDRLFRALVPVVIGRRSGREILGRLRKKWDVGRGLLDAFERARDSLRALSDLKGPATEVLDRLKRDYESIAPESIASLSGLLDMLQSFDVDLARVELDLGFGRGIGFYSQMIFECIVPTPLGPVEVCGGGRYDGLARVLGSDRDDRGVGFAIGLERLAGVIPSKPALPETLPEHWGSLIVAADPSARLDAIALAHRIRLNGGKAVFDADGLADPLGRARSFGLRFFVTVLGPIDAEGSIRMRDIEGILKQDHVVPLGFFLPDRDVILKEDSR